MNLARMPVRLVLLICVMRSSPGLPDCIIAPAD
jgi:hypothetical protein